MSQGGAMQIQSIEVVLVLCLNLLALTVHFVGGIADDGGGSGGSEMLVPGPVHCPLSTSITASVPCVCLVGQKEYLNLKDKKPAKRLLIQSACLPAQCSSLIAFISLTAHIHTKQSCFVDIVKT